MPQSLTLFMYVTFNSPYHGICQFFPNGKPTEPKPIIPDRNGCKPDWWAFGGYCYKEFGLGTDANDAAETSDSEKSEDKAGFEYDSSDDFVRSNNGNSESETEMESEYEDDGFVVSDEENLIDDGENDYVR